MSQLNRIEFMLRHQFLRQQYAPMIVGAVISFFYVGLLLAILAVQLYDVSQSVAILKLLPLYARVFLYAGLAIIAIDLINKYLYVKKMEKLEERFEG